MVSRSTLPHILVCAGTVTEWAATDAEQWKKRLALLAQAAQRGGAEWVTLVPYGPGAVSQVKQLRATLSDQCGGEPYADRIIVLGEHGVTVIVDLCADGQERIARAASKIGASHVTEQRLAATISAPAPGEPDLVVVLGSAVDIPPSLVWELAYAEIVFLDAPWSGLDAEHLEMAVDDFARRDRRFGGIDS